MIKTAVILSLCGAVFVVARYWYGLPLVDFGAKAQDVRVLEEGYWRSRNVAAPTVVVVATEKYALAGFVGDAGITLSIYSDLRGGWSLEKRGVTADACGLLGEGIPSSDAEFLDAHMNRALPTITYHAKCSGIPG